MNASDIQTAVYAGKDKARKVKSAKGGMPGSRLQAYKMNPDWSAT